MTLLQAQARALGDPTRFRVFSTIAEASAPVDVAELTRTVGVSHNAVRQHLARLVDADLVVEGTASASGRGRPRLIYRLAPSADGRWGATGPYERLSSWLAEIIRTGDDPAEVGRRVGRASQLGSDLGDDPVAVLVGEMARHGFDPTLRRRGSAVDITLRTCPFESTALAHPEAVCGLHLGIARGIAERTGGVQVDELVVEDPRRAGCRLRCHEAADHGEATT